MDQELKQRLIGAAVVTALAAIFIPMLFDDPVDTSGQAVSEMTIPEPPANAPNGAESKLPTDAASVENADGSALAPAASVNPPAAELHPAGGIEKIEPGLLESAADYEPPSEVEPNANVDSETLPDEEFEIVKTVPAPEPEPAVGSPARETSATPKSLTPETRTQVSEQPASPAAAKPAPAKPAENAVKPLPKSTAKFERWTIQAGSFTKKENAVSQRDKLRKLGFPAAMETISTGKGPIYRLKIGPELSKQRAIEIRNQLNQHRIKTIILAE
jgi:DedD protein